MKLEARMRLSILLMSLVANGIFLKPVSADPGTLNYQGQLTDMNSVPVNAVMSVTFRLYANNVEVWQEAHSLTVVQGYFSVELGSITPLTSALFQQTLFLGIMVGSDPEMTPRKVLSAAAYSFRAAESAQVNGYTPNSLVQLYRPAPGCRIRYSLTNAPVFDATCILDNTSVFVVSIGCDGNPGALNQIITCNNTLIGVPLRLAQ